MVKNKFKSIRTLQLILSFIIIQCTFCITHATVRYVSHEGSNTPPYTSWATAADSIMFAINISVFGDTIYVANGVYAEQVVMIPGLTLIGAGMDSCVIDTRSLAFAGFNSVEIKDSCIIKGFQIIVAHLDVGYGIKAEGELAVRQTGLITMNMIRDGVAGIYLLESDITVQNNVCLNNRKGIDINFSNSLIIDNCISSNYQTDKGIEISDLSHTKNPVIINNYIETNRIGISSHLGTKTTTIGNNTIVLIDDAIGIITLSADTIYIFNNLVLTKSYINQPDGISISDLPRYLTNNLVYSISASEGTGIYNSVTGAYLVRIKNNLIIGEKYGIRNSDQGSLPAYYNNVWNTDINYYGFTPDSTNLSVDPMLVNEDTTQGELDFHLQMFSPLIDAGDPNIFDRDGSRSDIGLYGGPYGWTYTYQDLAPRPPHNVTAVIEDGLVKLTWNKNTEADFSHYRIYRDTVSIVIYDSTKIIGETSDTVFYDDLPPVNQETKFYYVITAFDNQENQSCPSEEINVTVTGLNEHPPKGYDDYRLLSNYPNPFNPSTIIPYRLKEGGYVKLYIYDIKGELVRILVNEWQHKGYYEVTFQPNVRERQRANSFEVPMGKTYSDIATGVYIYMIQVKSDNNIPVFSDMGKMILLK